jgi:hypothetical protein
LQHAADYIMKLPEDVQQRAHWQIAIDRAVRLASQPIPLSFEFASYTDYRSWDMVDGR